MNTAEDIWNKLAKSKTYREEFALSFLKRSVSFQIKTLRKKRCGSQAILAERAKLTQGVVSRAEDQDYGNLTFNTVGRIAGGLDMAFIGTFVPFSVLVKYSLELSESELANIPTFDEESASVSSSFDAGIQTLNALHAGTILGQTERAQTIPENSALIHSGEKQPMASSSIIGEQIPLAFLPGNVYRMPRRAVQTSAASSLASCSMR
jgi:transcriptional regulator with XRE-family HTH domain